MKTTVNPNAVAYSYKRWSSPEQSSGDSLRRQTAKPRAWCETHGVTLDTTLRMVDAGVSAFRSANWENPDVHALAGFRQAVREGKVAKGSYLLVESFDRLSRDHWKKALPPIIELVNAGIRVVELDSDKIIDEDSDEWDLMHLVLVLARGRNESHTKSKRSPWANKRAGAAQKVVTRRVPGWVRVVGGEGKELKKVDPGEIQLKCIPERAAIVRRLFDLALEGHGVHTIAKKLNDQKVPTVGRKTFRGRPVRWNETTVYYILTSPATYGEYQPCRGRGSDRQPDGDPISGYYEAAITRDTFDQVAAMLSSRRHHGAGRRGKHVNIFAGLLRDARDGGSLTHRHYKGRGAIIPVGAKHGTGAAWSCFPSAPFESAVLSLFREVRPEDVEGNDESAKTLASIAARLTRLDEQIAVWSAKMEEATNKATVDQIVANLDTWNATRAELLTEQQVVRRAAAKPIAEAWGEARGILGLLAKDPSDDMRTKVRAALRRAIESIHCLFTGLGRLRLAAVRVQFRGGDHHRTYYIGYEPGRSNHHVKREGRYEVFTDTHNAAPGLPHGDLRQPGEAAAVERWLHGLADAINTPCENDPTDTVGLVGAIMGTGTRLVSVSRSPCE